MRSGDDLGCPETVLIDVVEADRRVRELREGRISPIRFLAKTVLPAPMNVIFLGEFLISMYLLVVIFDPDCAAIISVATQSGLAWQAKFR